MRPRIRAEARLSGLRERPQGERVCAFQTLRMEVAAFLFLEGDTEGPAVELTACLGFNHNRAKACDEQGLGFWDLFHGFSGGLGGDLLSPPVTLTAVLRF